MRLYEIENSFFRGNKEHKDSIKSCEPRVNDWVKEFLNLHETHSRLIESQWNREQPLVSLSEPLNYYDQRYINMLRRFHKVENALTITYHEAAMLIAADQSTFMKIAKYKHENTLLDDPQIVSYLKRIKPFTDPGPFFRGTTMRNERYHPMPFRSWSRSPQIAKMFADDHGAMILETNGPVKGFEINEVFYWSHILYNNGNGLGDALSEWLLLEPVDYIEKQ